MPKRMRMSTRNITSKADVLLLRGYRWDVLAEERGWIRALTESHVLFDEIQLSIMKPSDDLSKYKAVILPDLPSVPAWLCEKLDAFAENGGTVIATGHTGKYDENYDECTKYPLKAMGVKQVQYVREDMASAMLHVEESDLEAFDSYDNDRVLYFGDMFLFTEAEPEARGYLKLIPPHHFGPPERCYYTQITDIPGLTVMPYGKGQGVLVPWMPGSLFYRDGYANTFRFMRDLLKNIAKVESVEAEPFTAMIEVAVGAERTGKHMLIQLVNNSGHFGTSYLAPLPVYGVKLCVPCAKAPVSVESQTTGKPADFHWEDGKLYVTAEKVEAFEGLIAKF